MCLVRQLQNAPMHTSYTLQTTSPFCALQKKGLQEAVEAGLRAVNLWAVRRKRVGQFSGGMKRRLSVAISFIGDPRVVYLDECSTVGMLLIYKQINLIKYI